MAEREGGESDEIIAFLDTAGIMTSLSPATGQVLGHTASSLPGRHLTHLVATRHHARIEAWIAAPQARHGMTLTGRRSDDAPFPLAISLTPAPANGFVAILRDLSEQHLQEQETLAARAVAERALQDRGRFLTEMSHELRTPLNAIIGFAEIIATQRFGDEAMDRYRQYAQHILAGGEQMRDRIDELGTGYPEASAAGAASIAQPIPVRDLVGEVAGLLRGRAAAKNITIDCTVAGDPTIHGAPEALRQILLNLGSDAIANTPKDGHISLTATPDPDGRLSLTVTDSGGGIEAAAIPLLFDPYVRGKAQGDRPGLSVIKTLVEIHGGEFTVDSIDGQGAAFRIALPPDRWSASQTPDDGPNE
ncbi:MAG: sensor histidine kinase [Alphaproteobacteria bacterium]